MEPRLSRRQALRMMEASYLAAAAALIWLALYYLPIGGALFRLALPLPLALLLVRRGSRAGLEGVVVAILLLVVLMGPLRGPLMLFPYGLLSLWLGWCWHKKAELVDQLGARCRHWSGWIPGEGGRSVLDGGREPLGGDYKSRRRTPRSCP